jgi:hypothetical protein
VSGQKSVYEHSIDGYYLKGTKAYSAWMQAWESAFGRKAVLVDNDVIAGLVRDRGYVPVLMPPGWYAAGLHNGLPSAVDVLTQFELGGIQIVATPPELVRIVDEVWGWLESF